MRTPRSWAPCAAPPVGLVSWWRAESAASDDAGGNNGTLSNGVSFASGRVGQAFRFDGNNQAVFIPYSPTLHATNYSVEAWVNPSTQVSDPISQDLIFGQGVGEVQLVARPGSSGLRIVFQFGINQFIFYEVISTNDIPIGQFTHLVGTWDGTALRLYINGALNAQSIPSAAPVDSGCNFWIGGFINTAPGYCAGVGQFFNGLIDEVSFYRRALLPVEVQSLYLAERSGKCAAPTLPAILVQPIDQTVIVKSNAAFNVLAAGTSPISYQWRLNGNELPGETNTTLALAAVSADQAGSYDAVIANPVGVVTSAVAVLTVYVPPAPVFTLQPHSQIVPAGTNVTLTTLATNAWPFTYQWYLGGAALAGATSTILNLTDVQATNAGDYAVVAANAWNAATSTLATLTVLPVKPFLAQPPQEVLGVGRIILSVKEDMLRADLSLLGAGTNLAEQGLRSGGRVVHGESPFEQVPQTVTHQDAMLGFSVVQGHAHHFGGMARRLKHFEQLGVAIGIDTGFSCHNWCRTVRAAVATRSPPLTSGRTNVSAANTDVFTFRPRGPVVKLEPAQS